MVSQKYPVEVAKPQWKTKMTHQNYYPLTSKLGEKGIEAVPELIRILINNVTQAESSKYLQAEQYELTEDRKGHANGYKPKTIRTRIGEITFAVPTVQEVVFTLVH